MNALELLERLMARPDVYARAAAEILRRQHEAVQQLREALKATCDYIDSFGGDSTSYRAIIAKVEELK